MMHITVTAPNMNTYKSHKRVAPLLEAAAAPTSSRTEVTADPTVSRSGSAVRSSLSFVKGSTPVVTDAQLDEAALQAFADNIIPQEVQPKTSNPASPSFYTNHENHIINLAIQVNGKRLGSVRWKPHHSNHFNCKQFTMVEDGGLTVIGKAEGIVHCSAALALSNFWHKCTRRDMKRHRKQNGDFPREIYRKLNHHHEFYYTCKV
jgi:hypothetical protein